MYCVAFTHLPHQGGVNSPKTSNRAKWEGQKPGFPRCTGLRLYSILHRNYTSVSPNVKNRSGSRKCRFNMHPVNIEYSGNRPQVAKAVHQANELLRNPTFYVELAKAPQFSNADISPAELADIMSQCGLSVYIDLYYAFNPTGNVDGFDDPEEPGCVHLNIWRLDRPIHSICNSLLHGCVHAVNALLPHRSFGHGDFTLAGKETTAPVYVGMLAEKLISGNREILTLPLNHDNPAQLPASMGQRKMVSC